MSCVSSQGALGPRDRTQAPVYCTEGYAEGIPALEEQWLPGRRHSRSVAHPQQVHHQIIATPYGPQSCRGLWEHRANAQCVYNLRAMLAP